MRIALFGGTFNPIHEGHLGIAREVLKQMRVVEKVIFLPTYIPPHKGVDQDVSAAHRYEMVSRAISNEEGMDVADWEIKRQGVSYTVETIKDWMIRDNSSEKYIIMGSDSARNFYTWKNWQEIIENVRVLVYLRRGSEDWQEHLLNHKKFFNIYLERFALIPGSFFEVSSSMLRKMVASTQYNNSHSDSKVNDAKQNFSKEIVEYIPLSVLDYIKTYKLYR